MMRFTYLPLLLSGILGIYTAKAQIGIGTTSPNSDAVLEINASDKGLLIPRVDLDDASTPAPLTTHVAGMLVYNETGDEPHGFYYNNGSQWMAIGSGGGSGTNLYSANGTITAGQDRAVTFGAASTLQLDGSTLVINGDNNAVGIGTNTPNASAVLDVSSSNKGVLFPIMTSTQRDAIANPANGLLVYNSTEECLQVNIGTTTVPNWGCVGIENTSLSGECAGFSGIYVGGQPAGATHTFTTTLSNNSTSPISLDIQPSDLTLSGAVGAVTVTGVTPSGTLNLAAGTTQTLVFTLGGGNFTNGTLTGTFSNTGVVCSDEVAITQGNALFELPQREYVLSVHDGPPLVSVDGLIENSGSNQITFDVPYTSGVGTYSAYTSSSVPNNAGAEENGDANNFTISYSAGSFSSSGTITVTVTVDGDGSFEVDNQSFGETQEIVSFDFVVNGVTRGTLTIIGVGGIPDRAFNDDNVHKFIYKPILGFDGNYWLNQDLGANYSNFNHKNFDINGESTSGTDFNAYGSLFQWGRRGDGHELINWTSSTAGTSVNTSTTVAANTLQPTHDRFIRGQTYNWFDNATFNADPTVVQNLWNGEAATNNPCPEGYRVPSLAEWQNLIAIEEITNLQDASNSNFSFTATGSRSRTGPLFDTGVSSEYWTSQTNPSLTSTSVNVRFLVGGLNTGGNRRANGRKIRCIQD